MEKSFKRVSIWGISINPIRKVDFIGIINKHISSNPTNPLHITGVNPETISQSLNDAELLKAINDSNLVNIDNTLVLQMLRLSGVSVPERVATPDLFDSMLQLAAQKGYSVYLLGAKDDVLKKALENIKTEYPEIVIVGYRNGYFTKHQEVEICANIRESQPKMLFIALPTPNKELFIYHNKDILGVPVLLGVGGAIDVKAGLVKRAPLFFRNIGLEGIHRAIQNPLNYGKRYFTLYPRFVGFVIKEFFKNKKNNQK